jgi:hypothetical protein
MIDLLMIASLVAGFAVAGVYIWVCDQITNLSG